jgi:hypothetical protein
MVPRVPAGLDPKDAIVMRQKWSRSEGEAACSPYDDDIDHESRLRSFPRFTEKRRGRGFTYDRR